MAIKVPDLAIYLAANIDRTMSEKPTCRWCDIKAVYPICNPTMCQPCWEHQRESRNRFQSCYICSKRTTKQCGKCFIRYYCSKSCQQLDWMVHKEYCVYNIFRSNTIQLPLWVTNEPTRFINEQVRLKTISEPKKQIYCEWLVTRIEIVKKYNEPVTCCVCLDSLCNVVFDACGHKCCCAQCGQSLKLCPICQTVGEVVVLPYFLLLDKPIFC